MSVVSGPTALNAASKTVNAKVPGRSMRKASFVAPGSMPGARAVAALAFGRVDPVAMEIAAVRVEPRLGAADIRIDAPDQAPERP